MEDDHVDREVSATAPAAQARNVPAAGGQPGKADRRAERIEEYLQDSLDEENSLQANLGASAAELMHIRSTVVKSLKAELDTGPVTLEEYRKDFAPVVGSLLLLDRYIVAYARLGHDLSRADSSEGGGAPPWKADGPV